ncbi:hypothetical protein TASIC1_0009007000 [Trichoderma asperellum]|uniref:Uncharacterized protein n=1 Tax=Trichoderma asperellum TaxID=101201 RepID=A0A6V8R566_TRIAP|nr:hypothetical protein TASIC1_0009007000 [Trichoderma asperellum]
MANGANDELGLFFAIYPQFEYDPQEKSWTAYNRLVDFFGWKTNSKKERKARDKFKKALVGRFGQLYGTDENKLEVLQDLCRKVGISPVPSTITTCKKAISKVHVNIVDFIDSERTGEPVPTFRSLKQFQAYTTKSSKVFPKKEAKQSGLLRYLLRPVF